MNVQDLIAAAMKGADCASARQLAERMGVSHVAIGKWLAGENFPSFEAAAELADMAGLPVIQTAAAIRQKAPEGSKYRSLYKKMSAIKADSAFLVGRPGLEPGTNGLKVTARTRTIHRFWTSIRLHAAQIGIYSERVRCVLAGRKMGVAPHHLFA